MRRWTRQLVISVALVLGISGTATSTPGDPSSTSASFSIVEGEIGGNGQFNSASTNFTFNPSVDDGGSSLGETAVGNGTSTSFQTNSGFDTTAQPSLTFVVNTSTVPLGVLSTGAKTTGTATFNVKDYTSYGYVVQIVGATPSYGGHNLTALTTDTASSTGTEQFGINTVRNTVAAVGADPVQVPSSAFSFGAAGDGFTLIYGSTRPYTISDKWRYVSGETIASGPKSSGETDYTMIILANISTLTPSGTYAGNISLVATGTY